jgi:hypothetical protein
MRIALVGFFLLMTGCAAALVPETPEPGKKLANAYFLIDQGRSLPAQKLIGEALAIYTGRHDDLGMARAYSAFGDLYRNGRTEGPLTLPDQPKAVENYRSAIQIYEKLKMPKWAALNLWGVAVSQHAHGEFKETCQSLKKAKEIYSSAPDANEKNEPFEKAGAFNQDVLAREQATFKCG